MAVPTIRAVGAVSANAAAIAPGLPAGTAVGDLLVMFIETGAQVITCSGFTQYLAFNDATVVTRLTILYRIATGTDPTTTNDSGNHQQGRIIGMQVGTFDPVTPFHGSGITSSQAATTSVSINGPTTTIDDCLILAGSAAPGPDAITTTEFSSPANANLTNVTEQIDNTSTAGTGSGLLVISGELATAGAVGATTATAVTSLVRANICVAIAPAPAAVTSPPRPTVVNFAAIRATTY